MGGTITWMMQYTPLLQVSYGDSSIDPVAGHINKSSANERYDAWSKLNTVLMFYTFSFVFIELR
jgi:hypothetical protein